MCVNTENYTCCCCTLTTATYILGVFQVLGTIGYLITDQRGAFVVSSLTSLCYILVCMDSKNASYRKWLFQLVTLGIVLQVILLLIFYFIAIFSDSYIDDIC